MARRSGLAEADVDEVVSHAFETISNKREVIEAGRDGQYLLSVAAHIIHTRRRSRVRRREIYDSEPIANASDSRPSPDRLIDAHRAHQLLRRICEALPPRQHVVFRLSVFDGHSSSEVAALLGIAVPTVKSNLRRAWEAFRREANRPPASVVLRELGVRIPNCR